MKEINSRQLCTTLREQVGRMIEEAQELEKLGTEKLNKQPAPGVWSIAQVLEHLNSYNRYYLPHIDKALQDADAQNIPQATQYRPGFFGNYFTKMMQPAALGKQLKKYKAPKDHRPPPQLDTVMVLKEFYEGQQRLIQLLEQAVLSDLGKVKVPISISRLIRLKLGDTLRFLIAHQLRHFEQIKRGVRSVQTP